MPVLAFHSLISDSGDVNYNIKRTSDLDGYSNPVTGLLKPNCPNRCEHMLSADKLRPPEVTALQRDWVPWQELGLALSAKDPKSTRGMELSATSRSWELTTGPASWGWRHIATPHDPRARTPGRFERIASAYAHTRNLA